MPCRSYDDDHGAAEYARKADELASMLCEACTQLERAKIHFPSARLSRWWENHKAADKAAAIAAQKREENKRKKKNALRKLTPEEIRLLGILDR